MLIDLHHRIHNYLRISLTDACNFRCFYCMPNEVMNATEHSKLMQTNEIVDIAKQFVKLGVTKIRLTGGEPLVRKDAAKIMLELSKLPVQLSITTNGALLHQFIQPMKDAGIRSVNVSLDTLDASKFLMLTKRDFFQQVMDNIYLMLDNNFSVKINMVALKGINHTEVNNFVELTRHHALHVRFIEFMPFALNEWNSNKVFTYREILHDISTQFEFIKIRDEKNDTTKKYKVLNHEGTFAVISTMTEPFCSTCNRLRLTADGKMKNCLFSKTETDILTPFRKGVDITSLIHQNVESKAAQLGGQLQAQFEENIPSELENRSMIRIGG